MKKVSLLFCLLSFITVGAQDNQSLSELSYPISSRHQPVSMEMHSQYAYWNAGESIFNMKNGIVCKTSGEIKEFKICPNGSRIAIIYFKKHLNRLAVLDLWDSENVRISNTPKLLHPTSLTYTPDGKFLVVANVDGSINFYNSTTLSKQLSLHQELPAIRMQISDDGVYLATISNNATLNIWNISERKLLKSIPVSTAVNAIKFSDDCSQIAILTSDGFLIRYDMQNFLPASEFEAMGEARDFALHHDDKYIAVITGDDRVALINTYDTHDREYFIAQEGGIRNVYFITDSSGNERLVYNTANSIRYVPIKDRLLPNYTMLMADELDVRMDEWMNRMPGETLEEYNERVNEETIATQRRFFEEDIATRMAENLLADSEITLGSFNPESNILAVNFNTMPPAYLPVPSEDIGYFMNPENLEYRNARYALDENDKFELVYLDVYNTQTGSTYTFDNRERKSLDYMLSDDGFVPVDLVAMSNMEEMTLQGIKENIMDIAKQQNLISDHTMIDVTTHVSSDTDQAGNKSVNYNIGFSYNVEAAYSAQEDFTPGAYHIEKSGAAQSMCEIIRTAFETEFADYVKAGKKLRITITGMADSLPINGTIKYDGCYGDFTNYPVKGNGFSSVSVNTVNGITENPQLAFLRAVGVKESIEKSVPGIAMMETEYVYDIQIAEQSGGEYRRISVDFIFINAF